ncbi:hypothetical protein OsccyDRAFT_3955 [Leptolyngbyaceae cyanobacterium JSC-12]|nr:hypothetical protein OsccyDRAFT_3955 [Leptolyngbyaceae cyanobacterium JSC-12]
MRNGDPLLTTALSTGQGIAPTLPQQAIGIPSLPIENCQDLGILDTQWAELCALKAEQRYLKYLKRGILPQSAYRCALTHASAVTKDSWQA